MKYSYDIVYLLQNVVNYQSCRRRRHWCNCNNKSILYISSQKYHESLILGRFY